MVCIVTFARSWQALIATRALGKRGKKVITCDSERFATSNFSKYSVENFVYPDPRKDEKGFVSKLIEKARLLKKKFNKEITLIPIHHETFVVSKYKKQLSKHLRLCIEDYDKIDRIHDKALILPELKRSKIPHPKTYIINNVRQLYDITPKMRFPVFIKQRRSFGSFGLVKVDERDELIYKYSQIVKDIKKTDYPIIQEFSKGKDYCCTAVLNNGKLRAMMTYQNIKTYPPKAGVGVYRKNVKSPIIEKIAARFLTGIKWHGVIEIDFRLDGNPGTAKKAYIIDANPRFWGGLNQSVKSDVDYPWLVYCIASYGDCEIVKRFTRNVRTENLVTAIMALNEEIYNNKDKKKELKKLRVHWDKLINRKERLPDFLKRLAHASDQRYKLKSFREFLKRRGKVQDDIFDCDDPFVFMGILYPVYIFLKYGKVSKEILTGKL
ncbi:ATP-grasp domain-containing protein [Candidatus Woesearchaeota archaeon]|nr:ATP-grasp domain-containing protein [Candidatus Woesearchaeota archaeon]